MHAEQRVYGVPDDALAGSVEVVNGFWWPKSDTECRKVIWDWQGDLDIVLKYVTDFSAVVQAGGNCGVWPAALSKRFSTVYTFEPDPLNFYCLSRNCPQSNIFKMQACLGFDRETVDVVGEKRNMGALYVEGKGPVPQMRIDDLGLRGCGLIYLDIEGFEPKALNGAIQTIVRHKPVIAIENKGHAERYGYSTAGVERFIVDLGYKVVERPHRDVVFCASSA